MTDGVLSFDAFVAQSGVSRETAGRLQHYGALLEKWQARINLVGRSTLKDMWRRHFLDSTQLLEHFPAQSRRILDLGSGAGFPGLVVAAADPAYEVHLVESDQRKSVFLREAVRAMGLSNVTVHAERIEALEPFPVDVITSRALAPVEDLLAYGEKFVSSESHFVLLKGKTYQDELTSAQKTWSIEFTAEQSGTENSGVVLIVRKVQRRGDHV